MLLQLRSLERWITDLHPALPVLFLKAFSLSTVLQPSSLNSLVLNNFFFLLFSLCVLGGDIYAMGSIGVRGELFCSLCSFFPSTFA